jgi:hypothetical protein
MATRGAQPTAVADTETDAERAARLARGRRGLFVSLLTCALCVGGAELVFRTSYVGRRLAVENFYTVKADWYSASPGYDVAVVGDSRIMHGFDPREAERVLREQTGRPVSVWNAGLSGAPPMAHLAWVQRFLTHAHRPRLVVLSISPNMFGSLLPDPPARESLTALYRMRDLGAVLSAGASAEDVATVGTVNAFHLLRYRPRMLDLLLAGKGLTPEAGPGIQGFGPMGPVPPETQDWRARYRLLGYGNEMNRLGAHFGNEQIGYFRECLRRLRDAGVRTVVMNSPSATQLDAAYGAGSFYAQHMAFVRAEARTYGAGYFDAQHSPVIHDADFVDGDHMNAEGAARFSAWLARELLAPELERATGP